MADKTIEKTPTAGTSVNQPDSGTYGEKKAINDLKAALPPMGPGQAQPGLEPSPMPQPSPAMPAQAGGRPVNAPPGVPDAIFAGGLEGAPTPNAPAASPEAARLALLEQLASSQEVSETTREWAQVVLEALSRG